MYKKNLFFSFFLFLLTSTIYSQKTDIASADKKYEKFAYIDAIKTYERLFAKGVKTPDMLQKLGNSYYFNADLVNAAKWYGELFSLESAISEKIEPEYYYRYSQSLKAIKNYEKADAMLAAFVLKNGRDNRAKLALNQKDYLAVIKKNSGRYLIQNSATNSKESDYGSAFYEKNKLVFASERDKNAQKQSWTGQSYTNLYQATINQDGSLSAPQKFSKNLNSVYNESTPAFTKDGKTVYFTRNNFIKGKRKNNSNNSTLLKVYKADASGSSWTNIVELPFNSDEYNVAHPCLSADEKTLYFASDMPGTFGQSDIFKVAIFDNKGYGDPENLGKMINTEGRETFPFVTDNNELYFSSDGHPGLGGLDIFVAKLEKNRSLRKVVNIGEPINSSKDDFGFLIDSKTKFGYFTSNRDGGIGGDDIYMLQEKAVIINPCENALTGKVKNQTDREPIEGAKVSLYDFNFNLIETKSSDADGYFDFGYVNCESKYFLKSEVKDYTTKEVPILTIVDTEKTFVPIEMETTLKKISLNDDLLKKFNINTIYFDTDKAIIREDAAIELSKILDVMLENPTMEIDIRSHTDCRATAEYNLSLSDSRAKASVVWLIKNGIAKNRLSGKGYGESQLVNECADGVDCSEEMHQANRRSEFIITKL